MQHVRIGRNRTNVRGCVAKGSAREERMRVLLGWGVTSLLQIRGGVTVHSPQGSHGCVPFVFGSSINKVIEEGSCSFAEARLDVTLQMHRAMAMVCGGEYLSNCVLETLLAVADDGVAWVGYGGVVFGEESGKPCPAIGGFELDDHDANDNHLALSVHDCGEEQDTFESGCRGK